MAAMIDPAMDPCEDFFQYSCGNWLKNTQIPAGRDSVSMSLPAERQARAAVQTVVQERPPVIGEFYNSRSARIQNASSKFELAKLGGEFGIESVWLFTNLGFYFNEFNQSRNALFAGTGPIALPQDVVTSANASQYVLILLKLGGVTLPANATAVANAILDINKLVLNIQPSLDEFRALEALRYDEAVRRFPIGFKGMAEGARVLTQSALKPDSNVFFSSIGFFDRVEKQLWNAKSLDDLKNYYSFLYAYRFAIYLGDDFQANEDFFFGPDDEDRTVRCQREVKTLLPALLTEHVFDRLVGSTRQQQIQQIASAVQQAMVNLVAKSGWVDTTTRDEAMKKARAVLALIGKQPNAVKYPFQLKAATFADNFKTIQKYIWDTGLTGLQTVEKPVDRTIWDGGDPTVAQGSYTSEMNRYSLSIPVLLSPFFNASFGSARNFGATGQFTAATLVGGFNSEGRQYDAQGVKRTWWSDKAWSEFNKRANCVRDQLNQFVVRGSNGSVLGTIDGNASLDPSIEERTGLKLGFASLEKWLASDRDSGRQGVSADDAKKTYFIAYAQSHCAKGTDAWLLDRLQTSSGQIPVARINLAASNLDAFARAFQCKSGTKMNPTSKCVVW